MNDQAIIKAIRHGSQEDRNEAGYYLLQTHLKKFMKLIRDFRAIEESLEQDVRNLFSEAFLRMSLAIIKPGWQLKTAQLSTYFYAIAHNILKERYRKKQKSHYVPLDQFSEEFAENDIFANEDLQNLSQEAELRKEAFELLNEGCRQILLMKNHPNLENHTSKTTWKDLALQMQNSEGYLKKKACECRKKLDGILKELRQKKMQ